MDKSQINEDINTTKLIADFDRKTQNFDRNWPF